MARRTKAQIEMERMLERVNNRACYGLSLPIMELHKISDASKQAAASGLGEEEVYTVARGVALTLHKAA